MIDFGIKESFKKYVYSSLENGKRVDGRTFDDYREIHIKKDCLTNVLGSAYVKIGKTKVLCGVKAELGVPYPSNPDEGSFIFSVEFSPGLHFEKNIVHSSIEIARVIDRIFRESKTIDLKKLCIEEGKKAIFLNVDLYILNNDGNTIDAAFIASYIALKNSYLPEIVEKNGEYYLNIHTLTNKKVPIKRRVTSITFSKIKDYILIDPLIVEELISDNIFIIGISKSGKIHGLQTKGSGLFSIDEFSSILDKAKKYSKNLFKILEKN